MGLDQALRDPTRPFCAIDFETANHHRDSACAIGVVRVENRAIVARASRMIRPPRLRFEFTYLHGIDISDVQDKPRFPEVWRELRSITSDVDFFAAHNAGFDQNVLWAVSEYYGLRPSRTPFACSMLLARRVWNIRPTRLPDVCEQLGIALKHHDPLSDASACARIFLAAHHSPDHR